jgi:hypothetical protein
MNVIKIIVITAGWSLLTNIIIISISSISIHHHQHQHHIV